MGWRWNKILTVWFAIFVLVFAVASWFVHAREHSCPKSCNLKGFAAYEYKGFSGGGGRSGNLYPDSCTCTNVGGLSAAPAK